MTGITRLCYWVASFLAAGGLLGSAWAETKLEEALTEASPTSTLTFRSVESQFLPGKGKGTPNEEFRGVGIALIFRQNNYWTSNRYSAEGYQVKVGTLADSEGRLPRMTAYEISPPKFADSFSFSASGNDLFLRVPKLEDRAVYSLIKSDAFLILLLAARPSLVSMSHVSENWRIPVDQERSQVTLMEQSPVSALLQILMAEFPSPGRTACRDS